MQTLGMSQMKLDRQITVRLDVEELEFLQEKAKRYKIPTAVLARQYVMEGLAEFDRKHESLVNRMELLHDEVRRAGELASSAIAAACLLKDVSGGQDMKAKRAIVRTHIHDSINLGRQILKHHDDGEFQSDAPE